MLEYQGPYSKRNIYIKIIAWLVLITFSWQQVSYSWDLSYLSRPASKETSSSAALPEKEIKITNYDLTSNDESEINGLLSSSREQEEAGTFAPAHIQKREADHERLIRKQKGIDSFVNDLLGRKRMKKKDAVPLKKKKGGSGSGAPRDLNWTLSDWDEDGNPQQLNVYEYDGNVLKSITSYDIRGLDVSRWLNAGEELENKDGEKFFGGFDKELGEGLEYDRILNKIVYEGGEGEERIAYILSDFDENGTPLTVSVYDYNKDGDLNDNLDEVVTYDISGLDIDFSSDGWKGLLNEDLVTRTAVYEGEKDEEKIDYILDDYAEDENGVNRPHEVSAYDYEDEDDKRKLVNIRKYDISDYIGKENWEDILADLLDGDEATLELYKNDLISETTFTGAADEERADQVFYYADGEIVSRKDMEYVEYDEKYGKKKHALRRSFTYDTEEMEAGEDRRERGSGELVTEDEFKGAAGKEQVVQSFEYEDGKIIERRDYEYDGFHLRSIKTYDTSGMEENENRRARGEGSLTEESTFDGRSGREQIQQIFYYDSEGNVVERTDYEYENGRLVATYVYDTSNMEEDEDRRERGTGDLTEESTFEGRSGRERIQQTFYYDEDGNIFERKDYEYENGRLVATYTFDTENMAEGEDRRERGTGELTEESTFEGRAGEEKIQQTFYYDSDGNIISRKDYEYENGRLVATYTFDTENMAEGEDRRERGTGDLTEESTFEGRSGRERIQQTFYYDENGDIIERKDYEYDGQRLVAVYTFNTEDMAEGDARRKRGTGDLTEESIFEGRSGRERIQQTFFYDSDGNIIERRDYEYEGRRLVRSCVYDTDDESLTEAQRRARGEGMLVNEEFYQGVFGREKVNYTAIHSDISPDDGQYPDPNDPQFLEDAIANGATVEYYTNGKVKSIKFVEEDGERTYSYVYTGEEGEGALTEVGETKLYTSGAEPVERLINTFIYIGDEDSETLDLINSQTTIVDYIYEEGLLKEVIQFIDVEGGTPRIFDPETDVLKSRTVYKGNKKGEKKVDYILKYASDGTVRSKSVYIYDAETPGTDDNLDYVIQYKGETTEKEFKYIYDGEEDKEKVIIAIEYLPSGYIKGVSVYNYDLPDTVFGGDSNARTLDKVTLYKSVLETDDHEAFLADSYIKQESFYEGRESKERVKQVFTHMKNRGASGTTIIGRTDYFYDIDADDGLDRTEAYQLDAGDNYDLEEGVKTQEVLYVGFEGEERADQSFSFNANGNRTQKTIYKYGVNKLRAGDANLLWSDALTITEAYSHNNILVSESVYSGYQGDERVERVYKYEAAFDGDLINVRKVSRTDYYYHEDGRVNCTETYDIDDRFGMIIDPESTELLIQITAYNYDANDKYRLLTTITTGTQYHKQNASRVSGTYMQTAYYNDYEIIYLSVTTGESYYVHITDPVRKVSGSYTTTSNYDNFGTLTDQTTDGFSYRYDYIDNQVTTGQYTTYADSTADSSISGVKQIDEYGIIRETVTTGTSIDQNDRVTGQYDTISIYSENGILSRQETTGVGYSYVDLNGDGTIDENTERVVSSSYSTIADQANNDSAT
ncbi:MAG: hypothetical protein ISS91_01965, partial [Candidatus Omnitrophica bacterium]|nr:hypothetical protein [Candidatus Omnitrophota bacterium]